MLCGAGAALTGAWEELPADEELDGADSWLSELELWDAGAEASVTGATFFGAGLGAALCTAAFAGAFFLAAVVAVVVVAGADA